MDIKGEILDFINRNETTGALLLKGKWGCGKSFLVKKIAEEQGNTKKAAIAIVSLFGLDSVAAVNKSVKDKFVSFRFGALDKANNKITKAFTKIIKDGLEIANKAANGNAALSAASHGISSAMNYDVLGFIEIKNTIKQGEIIRKFVIVFDDLERSNLEKKELLGAINEYVENKQIKVIIIADEDKVDGEEYKEYKEKLISRTIKMTADYEALIDSIINGYAETAIGYKVFLKENVSLIKQVFRESQTDNLRILKTAIADFERIYAAWKESEISINMMKWALYTFIAEVFVSKAPKEKKENEDKKSISFLFDDKTEQYTNKGKNNSSFWELRRWIYDGVWNKSSFIEELTQKYSVPDVSPVERFILFNFWDLQQKDIDEGLPAAVSLAYEGELSRDQLIYILTKIHYLKEHSVTLPCEIRYDLMEQGFSKRIEGIKTGTINEPQSHTFAENTQLDNDALHLYQMIKGLEDQLYAWNNRKMLIDYFIGESILSRGPFRGLYIQELDDELLEVFKKAYLDSTNTRKRELVSTLVQSVFDFSTYSNERDIQHTKQNLTRLVEWLNAMPSNDSITALINQSTINEINKMNLMQKP